MLVDSYRQHGVPEKLVLSSFFFPFGLLTFPQLLCPCLLMAKISLSVCVYSCVYRGTPSYTLTTSSVFLIHFTVLRFILFQPSLSQGYEFLKSRDLTLFCILIQNTVLSTQQSVIHVKYSNGCFAQKSDVLAWFCKFMRSGLMVLTQTVKIFNRT